MGSVEHHAWHRRGDRPRDTRISMTVVVLSAGLSLCWWATRASTWVDDRQPWTAAAPDDRVASVGLWDVVAVEMNGKEIDPELVAMLQLAYRADGSWSVLFKGLTLVEGISTNDQESAPKTFDMETPAREHAKPQKYVGIYRLDGDSRQFCFVEHGQPRPDAFTAPRGSGRSLVTLRRAVKR